ncbi:unnamed protein product [Arabidopsis halleri]
MDPIQDLEVKLIRLEYIRESIAHNCNDGHKMTLIFR